jgi:DNA-binding NtrC family response regulator
MHDLKRTLLIVDDDDDIREILVDCAQRDGYAVFIARDGEEALACLKTQRVDAVLTDMMMPKMNGADLIYKIRSLGLSIPFVLISGVADDETVISAFRSGACDYIEKPFTGELISQVVNRVLEIGARLNEINAILNAIIDLDIDMTPQVEKIRKHQQQINRLYAVSTR